jgi:putative addiction module CopG family antidote
VTHLDTLSFPPSWHVMPVRKTMNVSITPELEQFVASLVASGQYQSASEVVRAALRLLVREENTRNNPRRAPEHARQES